MLCLVAKGVSAMLNVFVEFNEVCRSDRATRKHLCLRHCVQYEGLCWQILIITLSASSLKPITSIQWLLWKMPYVLHIRSSLTEPLFFFTLLLRSPMLSALVPFHHCAICWQWKMSSLFRLFSMVFRTSWRWLKMKWIPFVLILRNAAVCQRVSCAFCPVNNYVCCVIEMDVSVKYCDIGSFGLVVVRGMYRLLNRRRVELINFCIQEMCMRLKQIIYSACFWAMSSSWLTTFMYFNSSMIMAFVMLEIELKDLWQQMFLSLLSAFSI